MLSDPSLGRERTELAWQRTGLSYAGTGVVLLRALPDDIAAHRTIVGIGLILLGVTAIAFGVLHRRVTGQPAFRAVSLAMTALAGAAVVASWLS